MKIVKLAIIAISGFTLAFAAHAAPWSNDSVGHSTADAAAKSAQERAISRIRVTRGDIKRRRYTLVGNITAKVEKEALFAPDPTPKMVAEKLREKAAEMGADAVIFVHYHKVGAPPVAWALEGEGRAIKFRKFRK